MSLAKVAIEEEAKVPPQGLRTAGERRELAALQGGASFSAKMNVIAATVQVQRLKHAEEMPPEVWAALNQIESLLAEAGFKFDEYQKRGRHAKLTAERGAREIFSLPAEKDLKRTGDGEPGQPAQQHDHAGDEQDHDGNHGLADEAREVQRKVSRE